MQHSPTPAPTPVSLAGPIAVPTVLLAGLLVVASAVPGPGWLQRVVGGSALAQSAGGSHAAPTVGVAPVERRAVTSSQQYVGRIAAIDRVALVPRVTAYLDRRLFEEGAEVKKGDLLYVLEQGPFQAAVLAQQGALAQAQSTVNNAKINFQRQAALLKTPAGQRQAYDNAAATAQGGAANVLTAEGNLQSAQIQLGYTEIRAPVDGRITATSVNQGNVVSPSTGTLATIVTQDPMYVTFPVASRDVLAMQKKYAPFGGLAAAAIKLQLGDGSDYDHGGTLDYVSPTVSTNTDTITLRATVPNPTRGSLAPGSGLTSRELVDGEFVTVTVEDPHAVDQLVIPRAAVLSDQQGDYAFTVDAQNRAQRADLKLGENSGTSVVVLSGLQYQQRIIVDGLQRVHLGQVVTPAAPQQAMPDPGAPPGSASGSIPAASPASASNAAADHGAPAPASNSAPSQR